MVIYMRCKLYIRPIDIHRLIWNESTAKPVILLVYVYLQENLKGLKHEDYSAASRA